MYFRKHCRRLFYIGDFLIIWNLIIKETTSLNVITGNLPNPFLIPRLFNTFIGPIMKSLPANKPVSRTQIDKSVNEAIEQKVTELRTFLQDGDNKSLDDNLLFEGKDDTTIIEFIQKTDGVNNLQSKEEKFKTNLKKYKKIREKINKALIKESVSDKTKNLVIKTIDDLLRKLIGSQCKWKRTFGAEEPSLIADKWNEGLHKIGTIITDMFRNKTDNLRKSNNGHKDLDNLQIVFRSLAKDVDMISKRYKIQCEFVRKRSTNQALGNVDALRNNWDKTDTEDERYHNVYICSDELKEYLGIFYSSLKETSVSVIRNYAEMYKRDVAPDDEEKEKVISILRKLTNNTEFSVLEIFIRETESLKLDNEKNKDSNVYVLSDYVKNTIRNIKENITCELNSETLQTVREKIQKVIRDDLKVNIDIDLGNLEREFLSKICTIFRLCNGKYGGRRINSDDEDRNNLYVQVQLTLDDDMTDIDNFRRIFNVKNSTVLKGLNVTRTTYNSRKR